MLDLERGASLLHVYTLALGRCMHMRRRVVNYYTQSAGSAAEQYNTIQYNSLHHTHRAMLTAARRPDIHRVPHNHSPRHTQSHTLGHWTPWDSDRSEVTLKTTADQTTSPWPHTHSAFLYALLTRCTPRRAAESAQSSGHQAARLGTFLRGRGGRGASDGS